jgi:CBS domain-containing protein
MPAKRSTRRPTTKRTATARGRTSGSTGAKARKTTSRTGTAKRRTTGARGTSTTKKTTAKRTTPRRTTTGRRTATTRGSTTGRTTTRRSSASRDAASTNPIERSQLVQEVMTRDPVCLIATQTLVEAAEAMRERDVGDVIVLDETNGLLRGIVTDRDIVVRGVAEGREPAKTTLSAVCTEAVFTISPGEPVTDAVRMMRDRAIRRLPVVEEERPVGIVSLGDLAIQRDSGSVLAAISAAPAND